ncbi:MAG: GNAT family N-acetyltransferase [Bacteroidetes bacterium]|jgi:RimJ/RimL family protein N-acetyltransferase|nr:MAG: GNAT family N-acetyltransferase [Bacteroidota bacterium]
MIPSDLVLETSRALLRPLQMNDFESFLELAKEDSEMWEYFTLNLGDEKQLRRWFEMAFADKAANTRRPFTIIDKETGKIAGSSSLGNISMHDLRAEIGWSWLGKDFRSTGLNKNAKFAMMRYAFDELNFERIEFKTDVLNARARQGLKNVGGIEEGVLRSHMTMWNNRRRSSIYYSVLKDEWPRLKETIFAGIG